MTPADAGGFVYRTRSFPFVEAKFALLAPGELHLAAGPKCELRIVGAPFPGAATPADLVGRSWDPDDEDLALHSDVFAEGGVRVRERDLWIVGGRIAVKRFDAERNLLTATFVLTVQDGEYGEPREVDGVARCLAAPESDFIHRG